MSSIRPNSYCRTLVASILLLSGSTMSCALTPTPHPIDDASSLGSMENFLFWTPGQQIASYRNMDRVTDTRVVSAGGTAYPLPVDRANLDEVEFSFGGMTQTVDEYFSNHNVGGLLVIKKGKIVYERYGLGNTEETLWVSFSVAKSVVSLLIGAAIRDGYIQSVDEKVTDYLPRLKGSSYDQASIRNVLQMASGVRWNEDYADPKSDVNVADFDTLSLFEYLRHKPRDAEPGTLFNYNSAETNLVGALLRSAIGNNLATYLSDKIWRLFGMEADANWLLEEPAGGESGGCCISATLRDYGRIGMFALNEGRLADGTEVLAEGWMKDSIRPSKASDDYGYLWWLEGDGVYAAYGIFGQRIYINPREGVVIAQHSAWPIADKESDWLLQNALFDALVAAVRR